MALRDAMRASAAQFVEPGETIQEVFAAQTASPMMMPLVGAIVTLIVNKNRIVAVTDQRILVLDAGKWSMRTARSLVTELPRSMQLGPASGLWHKIDTPTGKIHVRRAFFKDIKAADSLTTPDTGQQTS